MPRPIAAKLTALLPTVYGFGAVPQALAQRYAKPGREETEVSVRGVRLLVRPQNPIESALLFGPQFYDRHELEFVESRLREGDRFLDVGSFIGVYGLVAAARVGPSGRVACIEMDPRNATRIERHAALNGATNVRVVHAAAGDADGEVEARFAPEHATTFNSLLATEGTPARVQVRTLATLLRDAGLDGFDGAKLDIEGYEAPVLARWFADADPRDDPRFLVVERSADHLEAGARDPHPLLIDRGYRHVGYRSWNHFYEKP